MIMLAQSYASFAEQILHDTIFLLIFHRLFLVILDCWLKLVLLGTVTVSFSVIHRNYHSAEI